ncbi:MAG TPA: hypothetical protein VEZ48_04770 [Sphingomonadaceae bacterium]|jgi:hypothetical protein|nr:hypothetical protein [Sphingomonadaceae bacterium]
MTDKAFLDKQQDALVSRYVVEVTIPLLADNPKLVEQGPIVLGTGTLFAHGGRHFIVTAAHILKKGQADPASEDIDLEAIVFRPAGAMPRCSRSARSSSDARNRRRTSMSWFLS